MAIAAAGGIAPLVDLVRDGSADAKKYAAGALNNLAGNAANAAAIAAAGGVAPLEQLARDGEEDAKEWAAAALWILAAAAADDDDDDDESISSSECDLRLDPSDLIWE